MLRGNHLTFLMSLWKLWAKESLPYENYKRLHDSDSAVACFFGGYVYFFLPRIEPAWLAYVLAGVSGLMLYLALGAIKTLFQTRTIAAALRRARQMRLPDDGKLALIKGEVTAVGEPLNAPFSNTPCVAYEYHLYRVVRTNSRRETGYRSGKDVFAFGLGKTAYLIRTPEGDVRPLGYHTLDHLSKASWLFTKTQEPQIRQRTEDYLQYENFQKAGALGMASAFSQLISAVEKDTDYLREDWKVHNPDNLDGATLDETCLQPGQQVCALGKWDTKRMALHPPIELIAGDYEKAQKILIANKRSSAVFGLIFAILFSAILIAFAWFSSPLSPEAGSYRNESFPSLVQSALAYVIREMCQGDVDPNQRDTFGTPVTGFWE
jgi:hypothetical protein